MYGHTIRPQTNHLAHLLLSCMTLGLWLPVWFIVAVVNASKRVDVMITQTPSAAAYPTQPRYPHLSQGIYGQVAYLPGTHPVQWEQPSEGSQHGPR